MANGYRPYKLKPNNQLEKARAREIWTTYTLNQDAENMKKLILGSSKWFDSDGVKRIHNYVRQFRAGLIE
jgi:hypothetical protein